MSNKNDNSDNVHDSDDVFSTVYVNITVLVFESLEQVVPYTILEAISQLFEILI